jgi:hypothetical protein
VSGYGVKHHDLLALQLTEPPASVLSSVCVEIQKEDRNKGTITMDEDSDVLVGAKSVNKVWRKQNNSLASLLEAYLDKAWKKKYGMEGTTPLLGRLSHDFQWPDELKSQLNPIDPWIIGFRDKPTAAGNSIFENKTVAVTSKSGRVVPAVTLTVFYLVEKDTHFNNTAGRDLKIGEASDSDTDPDTPSPKKRARPSQPSGDNGSGGVEEMKIENTD